MHKEFVEVKRFREMYNQQIEKIQRKMDYFLFKEENFIKNDDFLVDMFLESILVDVRALLMENERYKKNYTIQNSFRMNALNKDEDSIFIKVADDIDKYLKDTLLPDGETSFFEAVKFYTDKYIAHRDSTDINDDEKKKKIRNYFLENEEFGLAITVKAIIKYTEEIEREIKYATLEALTKLPEGIELEDINDSEPNVDIYKDWDLTSALVKEILKKSSKDIEYLIGFDVRGKKIYEVDSEETRNAVTAFVESINEDEVLKFVVKVKETPNRI